MFASKLSLSVIVLAITFQSLQALAWRLLSYLMDGDNNSLAIQKKAVRTSSPLSPSRKEEMPQEVRMFPHPRGMLRTMLAP